MRKDWKGGFYDLLLSWLPLRPVLDHHLPSSESSQSRVCELECPAQDHEQSRGRAIPGMGLRIVCGLPYLVQSRKTIIFEMIFEMLEIHAI